MNAKTWSDPETYRALSKPKVSVNDLQADFNAFFDELELLRKKYAIPDIAIVLRGNAYLLDGRIETGQQVALYGDYSQSAAMLGSAVISAADNYRSVVLRILENVEGGDE